MSGIEQRITVELFGKNKSAQSAEIVLIEYSRSQLVQRAFYKGILLVIAGAILTVTPAIHLVGLLTLFIGLPCFLFLSLRKQTLLLEGKASCPECKAEITFIKGALNFPFYQCCGACKNQIRIEKKSL